MGAQQTAQDTAAVEAAEVEVPNPTQEATDEPEGAEESRYPTRKQQNPTSWWEAKPRANVAATTQWWEPGKQQLEMAQPVVAVEAADDPAREREVVLPARDDAAPAGHRRPPVP